nr:MAG TPA: YecM protein [Caudoviricetes sp.]
MYKEKSRKIFTFCIKYFIINARRICLWKINQNLQYF